MAAKLNVYGDCCGSNRLLIEATLYSPKLHSDQQKIIDNIRHCLGTHGMEPSHIEIEELLPVELLCC